MNKTYAIISLCCAFGFGLALGIPQAVGLGTPSVDMGSYLHVVTVRPMVPMLLCLQLLEPYWASGI